jgi:phospholipid N-methyltransferase
MNNTNGHDKGFTSQALKTRSTQLFFFWNFLRNPREVGWLVPSSNYLVRHVLDQIDFASARVLVEFGPGTGTFTAEMLKRMRPDARLIVFEIGREFADYLRHHLADPRLVVEETSAAEVDHVLQRLGVGPVDAVVSGIPFTALPPDLRDQIVRKSHAVLRPGGRMLVYQVSKAVLPNLQKAFGSVAKRIEFRNLIPTRLFFCQR